MKVAERSLRVVSIDASPKAGEISGDRLIAASGLLTGRSGSLLKEAKRLGDAEIKKFHLEATRRGHASILTTPTLYFWMEGSRMIDFFFTAFPFGSYLIFSSRRIPVERKSLLIPFEIKKSRLGRRYEQISLRMLESYKKALKEAGMDFARCLLPLGFSSYGLFSFPLQTLLTAYHEASRLRDNFPAELRIACKRMLKIAKKSFPLMISSAALGGETGFTFPNIFGETEIREKPGVKIVYLHEDLPKILKRFKKEGERDYRALAFAVQNKILVRVVGEVSLAAWNEIKRHRTVRQSVESLYLAAERGRFYLFGEEGKKYKEMLEESISLYEDLVSEGISKSEALYILPHALKVKITLLLDGYHLFSPFGFFGVRMCSKAYAEVREFCMRVKERIAEQLPEAGDLIEPKCKLGKCPERESCGYFRKFL